MIDGMKSSKLREKSSIGNIISDIFPAIDAFCPVVSPIVHTSRFESVRPHIINVSARPFIGHGPIRKGFHKFRFLSFHQLPAFLFFGGKFLVIFKQFASFVNISPTLKKNREITKLIPSFWRVISSKLTFEYLNRCMARKFTSPWMNLQLAINSQWFCVLASKSGINSALCAK